MKSRNETESLKRRLSNKKKNLRLIRERKSEFVQPTKIPLQLIKDERRLEQEIESLRAQLEATRGSSNEVSDAWREGSSNLPLLGLVQGADNRSGGVYFEGEGPVHIQGEVIGGDQTKTSHKTHFHGPITGPVHTGSGDIHIGSMLVGADASLEILLTALRKAVAAHAPPIVQSKALQRVDLLAESIVEDEPDLGLMESALGWFQKHLPSLVSTVVTIIFHPTVAQTIAAAGEPAVAEFRRRFGQLSEQREFTDE